MPAYIDSNPAARRVRYQALASALKVERQVGFDAHWKELGDYFMPRRTRFWTGDRNRGDKRNQNIIDSTGRFSARTLASGLHAGLTSPARPWMKLTTHNPELAKQADVKQWLHEVSELMLTIFATSNLYNVLPIVYGDLGIFGTAAMAIIEDTRDVFRAYAFPTGSFALGQDARGLVATFVREYQLTVRQVVEDYGVQPNGRDIDWSRISSAVHTAWNRGDYETTVDVCWMVKPNEMADPKKLGAKYLPFSSCHFELAGSPDVFLRESGYKTFPIMAPRWDITGEDSYGTDCPGMTALGDNKQLQVMQKRKAQLLAKAVDPPLVGPSSLRTQKTSLMPGDITYLDVREGMQKLGPIHETRLEGFQHLSADVADVQYRVQRAFYEDLFLMLARSDAGRGSQPVTAREIDERHEEKLLALGPVLERTNDELLDPIVDRVYEMMDRAGLIPPPPESLNGIELRVEYISILAQAQKLVGVVGQDRFLQSTAALIGIEPTIAHKIDWNQVVDNYADMLGVDPKLVIPTDQAKATVAAAQQAMQAQQQAEQNNLNAKSLEAASKAKLDNGDTALSRLVQNAGATMPTAPQPPAGPPA